MGGKQIHASLERQARIYHAAADMKWRAASELSSSWTGNMTYVELHSGRDVARGLHRESRLALGRAAIDFAAMGHEPNVLDLRLFIVTKTGLFVPADIADLFSLVATPAELFRECMAEALT